MSTGPIVTLSPLDFDAVLFDLDGVLTRTAVVHTAAWKKLFDDFLRQRSASMGEPFVPFDEVADYRRYVDGRPRYDGVAAFLESRGVELSLGSPADGPDVQSIYGLGALKDQYFSELLQQHGVAAYEAAVALVRSLRAQDVKTAVVSSSKNCAVVLDAVGIAHLFDARVDGMDITRLGLKGKPAPDAFLHGAQRLRVEPSRAVVIEDAIAGVQAGRAGGFALVIGVDRVGQSQALRDAGADVVVTNLGQVQVTVEPPSAWALTYDRFDPAREGMRESLCALGNGYFGARGAAAWARADGLRYPGVYLAGGYNRLETDIAGRVVENEDLVNLPNWLSLNFRIADEAWFDERSVDILAYCQELDLRRGLLLRRIRFQDHDGRRTALTERRFVSMAQMHLGALEFTLMAENWSADVTIRSGIDGGVVNSGAQLYRPFNNQHMQRLSAAALGSHGVFLQVRTRQSRIEIAQAIRTNLLRNDEPVEAPRRLIDEDGYIGQEFSLQVKQGQTIRLEKTASLHTSRDPAISESGVAACKSITRAGTFEQMCSRHVLAWKHLWRRFDIHIMFAGARPTLNVPMLLRLNICHLLQSASLNSIGLDIGVPARGWTGEAYQGHIFWDELFIFPTLNFRTPEITRSLLMYRYRRLDEARAAAAAAGFKGAMYPWQSGSDGQEETQELNLNPHSQRWIPDNSFLQRHVGSAVAWNVWQYFQVTGDVEFLDFYGAEMILEIARFWGSAATFSQEKGRYEIRGVMGPDEYHEGYPEAPTPGLNNNAYTNVMAVWVLSRALEVLELLSDIGRAELRDQLQLSSEEVARWDDISRRMFIPFHEDGIISQFEGYEHLAELDWERYRLRYGNIQRLDLILEAEGDSANRYKLSKQADVLMLFYLFSTEMLEPLFKRLNYDFDPAAIPRIIAYYDARSSHGSTLSRVVHAWVLARSDRPRAMRYFAEALQSDVSDIQQGTTAEGVHLGAMAGTVDLIQRVVTGIEATGDALRLNPRLPEAVVRFDMRIVYRGNALDLRLTHDTLTVRGHEREAQPIKLELRGEIFEFRGGETREFKLTGSPLTVDADDQRLR